MFVRERPLIVVLDDMQWADAASHHIVQLLLTRLAGAPLLLVLTVRDGAGDAELQATFVALARSTSGSRIELGGLPRDAVAHYLERTIGAAAPDDVVDLLVQRTAGNAFYLTELVRLLGSDQAYADADVVERSVPGTVRDVINRRVSELPQDAERLLGVAAVAGREFDWRVVTKVAEVEPDDGLEALDAAVVSGLIEDAGTATKYRFAHDLVREALYGELSTPRQAKLHAGVAEELFALHGRSPRTPTRSRSRRGVAARTCRPRGGPSSVGGVGCCRRDVRSGAGCGVGADGRSRPRPSCPRASNETSSNAMRRYVSAGCSR